MHNNRRKKGFFSVLLDKSLDAIESVGNYCVSSLDTFFEPQRFIPSVVEKSSPSKRRISSKVKKNDFIELNSIRDPTHLSLHLSESCFKNDKKTPSEFTFKEKNVDFFKKIYSDDYRPQPPPEEELNVPIVILLKNFYNELYSAQLRKRGVRKRSVRKSNELENTQLEILEEATINQKRLIRLKGVSGNQIKNIFSELTKIAEVGSRKSRTNSQNIRESSMQTDSFISNLDQEIEKPQSPHIERKEKNILCTIKEESSRACLSSPEKRESSLFEVLKPLALEKIPSPKLSQILTSSHPGKSFFSQKELEAVPAPSSLFFKNSNEDQLQAILDQPPVHEEKQKTEKSNNKRENSPDKLSFLSSHKKQLLVTSNSESSLPAFEEKLNSKKSEKSLEKISSNEKESSEPINFKTEDIVPSVLTTFFAFNKSPNPEDEIKKRSSPNILNTKNITEQPLNLVDKEKCILQNVKLSKDIKKEEKPVVTFCRSSTEDKIETNVESPIINFPEIKVKEEKSNNAPNSFFSKFENASSLLSPFMAKPPENSNIKNDPLEIFKQSNFNLNKNIPENEKPSGFTFFAPTTPPFSQENSNSFNFRNGETPSFAPKNENIQFNCSHDPNPFSFNNNKSQINANASSNSLLSLAQQKQEGKTSFFNVSATSSQPAGQGTTFSTTCQEPLAASRSKWPPKKENYSFFNITAAAIDKDTPKREDMIENKKYLTIKRPEVESSSFFSSNPKFNNFVLESDKSIPNFNVPSSSFSNQPAREVDSTIQRTKDNPFFARRNNDVLFPPASSAFDSQGEKKKTSKISYPYGPRVNDFKNK